MEERLLRFMVFSVEEKEAGREDDEEHRRFVDLVRAWDLHRFVVPQVELGRLGHPSKVFLRQLCVVRRGLHVTQGSTGDPSGIAYAGKYAAAGPSFAATPSPCVFPWSGRFLS